MLLGIAMILVLIENERNIVRENALAFSTLGVDSDRLLSASARSDLSQHRVNAQRLIGTNHRFRR